MKQLLGELYEDRDYLERLLHEEDEKNKRRQAISGSQNEQKEQKQARRGRAAEDEKPGLREAIISGLNYLDKRSEFWQQQVRAPAPAPAPNLFLRPLSSPLRYITNKQTHTHTRVVLSCSPAADVRAQTRSAAHNGRRAREGHSGLGGAAREQPARIHRPTARGDRRTCAPLRPLPKPCASTSQRSRAHLGQPSNALLWRELVERSHALCCIVFCTVLVRVVCVQCRVRPSGASL